MTRRKVARTCDKIRLGAATTVVALLVVLAADARAATPIKVRFPAPGKVFVAPDAAAAGAMRRR